MCAVMEDGDSLFEDAHFLIERAVSLFETLGLNAAEFRRSIFSPR